MPEFVIVVAAHTPKPAAVEPRLTVDPRFTVDPRLTVEPMVNACAAVAASKSPHAKESG